MGGRIDSVSGNTWLSYLRLFPYSPHSSITGPLNFPPFPFRQVREAANRRLTQLTAQTSASTISQSNRAATSIAAADAEIARFREILRQIDELETEFDKVRHIRDIVKSFRARVEGLERRVDGRAPPGHHGSSKGRGTIRR